MIQRRFDRFFKEVTGLERRLGEIDVGRVFRELEDLPPKPEPPIPQPKPPPKQEIASGVVEPEEPDREDAYSGVGPTVRWWWIALLALVAAAAGGMGTACTRVIDRTVLTVLAAYKRGK